MNDFLSVTESVGLRRRLSNDSGSDRGRTTLAGRTSSRNRRQSLIVSKQKIDVPVDAKCSAEVVLFYSFCSIDWFIVEQYIITQRVVNEILSHFLTMYNLR